MNSSCNLRHMELRVIVLSDNRSCEMIKIQFFYQFCYKYLSCYFEYKNVKLYSAVRFHEIINLNIVPNVYNLNFQKYNFKLKMSDYCNCF